jgi:hypothetical protein
MSATAVKNAHIAVDWGAAKRERRAFGGDSSNAAGHPPAARDRDRPLTVNRVDSYLRGAGPYGELTRRVSSKSPSRWPCLATALGVTVEFGNRKPACGLK